MSSRTEAHAPLITQSDVRVFVDGEMAGAAPLRFPRLHDHAIAFTGVGKMYLPPGLPPPPPHQALAAQPFHGQLGMVYMFEDALSDPQVALLHQLGPNYQVAYRTHVF
jgi:hypothetical protein